MGVLAKAMEYGYAVHCPSLGWVCHQNGVWVCMGYVYVTKAWDGCVAKAWPTKVVWACCQRSKAIWVRCQRLCAQEPAPPMALPTSLVDLTQPCRPSLPPLAASPRCITSLHHLDAVPRRCTLPPHLAASSRHTLPHHLTTTSCRTSRHITALLRRIMASCHIILPFLAAPHRITSQHT